MGTAFPFRWAFTGLLLIAVAGIVAIDHIWHTPYRPVGIGAGLLFLVGSANNGVLDSFQSCSSRWGSQLSSCWACSNE